MNFNHKYKFTLAAAFALMIGGCAFGQALVPQKDAKKDTWGYMNTATNKWAVKPQFETAGELKQQPNGKMRATVVKKGLQGLVDENGKALGAGIVFEAMTPLQGDALLVTVKGKHGIVNYDGVYLLKPEITELQPVENLGYIYTVKGKQGFFAMDGSVKVPAKDFAVVKPLENDLWIVGKDASGQKLGMLRTGDSKPFIDCRYTYIKPGNIKGSRFYFVKKKDGMGLANESGKEVLKCQYNSISDFGYFGSLLCENKAGKRALFLPQEEVSFDLKNFLVIDYPLGIKKVSFQFETPWEGYQYIKQKEREVFQKHFFVAGATYSMGSDDSGRSYTGLDKEEADGYTILTYDGPTSGSKLYTYIRGGKALVKEATEPLSAVGSWLLNDRVAYDTSAPDVKPHKVKMGEGSLRNNIYVLLEDGMYHSLSSHGELSEEGFEGTAEVPFNGGYYLKKVNGQWGVYSNKESYLSSSKDPVLLVDNNDPFVFLNSKISDYDQYYTYAHNGKVGLINVDRGEINKKLEAEYDSIKSFYGREFEYLLYKNGKCFLYSIVNHKPITREYDKLAKISGDDYNFIYEINGLQGFVDFMGEEHCSALYTNLTYDSDYKLYRAKRNGKDVMVGVYGTEFDGTPQVWISPQKAHIYTRRYFGRELIVQMSFGFSVGTMFAEGNTYKIVAKLTRNGKEVGSNYVYNSTVAGSDRDSEISDGVFFDVENLNWYEGIKGVGCKVMVYDSKGKLVASKNI